jgi:hypothetical protein
VIPNLFLLLLLVSNLGGAGFIGPGGNALPFEGYADAEAFLREAEVVSRTELRGSSNRPEKLLLRAGGVEAYAVFRTVDKKKASAKVGKETIRDFHDSHVYECAAYELSRLLGIESVPPCVLRTFDGVQGSLQLWIEEAVTAYQDRQDSSRPALEERLSESFQTMYLFDALIDNFDRHPGNILVDSRGRLWLVDHTRSFRLYTNARSLDRIVSPDPALVMRLAELDRDALTRSLSPLLGPRHIDALLRRRGQILRRLARE